MKKILGEKSSNGVLVKKKGDHMTGVAKLKAIFIIIVQLIWIEKLMCIQKIISFFFVSIYFNNSFFLNFLILFLYQRQFAHRALLSSVSTHHCDTFLKSGNPDSQRSFPTVSALSHARNECTQNGPHCGWSSSASPDLRSGEKWFSSHTGSIGNYWSHQQPGASHGCVSAKDNCECGDGVENEKIKNKLFWVLDNNGDDDL